VILFPNCKINIGLNITDKRPDGYHNLESIFYPLPLSDVLEAVPAKQFEFKVSGLPIQGPIENNLCLRAIRLIKTRFANLPQIGIYLHKHIPIGAGLGGGSADAVFLLVLLNHGFDLGLSSEELLAYAAQLGSDCPFFLVNQASFVSGKGDHLLPVALDLSAYSIVLIHSGIHIDTSWAFSTITPCRPKKSVAEIVRRPVKEWRQELKNDFEKPVFSKYPELERIKEKLYEFGALFVSLTGSGSSIYGIFEKNRTSSVSFEPNIRVDILK
jgi:4-diphosphocytidyl-2-C-methyl-D-erythritol kinase